MRQEWARSGWATARRFWLGGALALCLTSLAPGIGLASSAPELVFGAATAELEDSGSLIPKGDGRFETEDRRYVGKSVARSVTDEWAACLSGRLTSREDWSLETPKLDGTHRSTITIRSERAVVTLRLRGQMEYPTASGSWEITRATGACAGLDGEGRYTVSFSSSDPELRLTFEGEVQN